MDVRIEAFINIKTYVIYTQYSAYNFIKRYTYKGKMMH